MKLAVSNIAWPREQDAAVADALRELGVTGIEVAPTKVWPQPLAATDAEVDAYRRFWNDRGIEIIAAQALLFGKPELTLFDSPETRARTLDYLTGIVRLCSRLGAGALVFGSPKNRRVGNGSPHKARQVAAEFFGRLAGVAEDAGAEAVHPRQARGIGAVGEAGVRLVGPANPERRRGGQPKTTPSLALRVRQDRGPGEPQAPARGSASPRRQDSRRTRMLRLATKLARPGLGLRFPAFRRPAWAGAVVARTLPAAAFLLILALWAGAHLTLGLHAIAEFDPPLGDGPYQLFNPLRRIDAGQ